MTFAAAMSTVAIALSQGMWEHGVLLILLLLWHESNLIRDELDR